MRTLTLHVPGSFDDAYVYMGWLVAITSEKSFRFYRLDEIVGKIREMVPNSAFAAELMFRHNEWLTSAQFAALADTPSSAEDIAAQFERFPQCLEIPSELGFEESDSRVATNIVLDYFIYNRRIYLGGKDGLFSALVDWDQEAPVLPAEFEPRLEARCLNLTGRFGAVVASCGDDGLFWSAQDAYWQDEQESREWKQAEPRSLKARWLANEIVNYRSIADLDLLRVKRTRSTERRSDDEGNSVVTAIGQERIPLQAHLLAAIRRQMPDMLDASLIQYIFNSDTVVFIFTIDGHFFALHTKAKKVGPPEFRFTHTYKGADTRILSASTTKRGAVLETENRVLYFADGQWTPVLESPALSVRTFPQSKNFQNMVSVTTEEGVYLVGLFDETRNLQTM